MVTPNDPFTLVTFYYSRVAYTNIAAPMLFTIAW